MPTPVKTILISLVMMMVTASSMNAQAGSDTIRLDTVEEVKKKGSIFKGRPGRSFLFSMIVPGAGQIYNKSYLRVPFVWGAVGGMGYLLYVKSNQYECSRDAYIAKVDNLAYSADPDKCGKTLAEYLNNPATTATDIRSIRDRANKYRQQTIIGFSLVWLANGIDAFVDAHLKDFDVDDDLSIDFSPRLDDDPYAPMRVGIFLTLK